MRILLILIITAGLSVLFPACTTVPVKYVNPGTELSSDSGYIAMIFANEVKAISFGSRYVYIVLKNSDSRMHFYIPFGSGGEIRLFAVVPGKYQIESFVCMTGIETARGNNSHLMEKGVLYSPPQLSGTSLVRANYPADYCRDFMVGSGEIVYIGDYSWKSEFAMVGPGIIIEKSIQSDDTVLSGIHDAYPNIPDSIKFMSFSF